MTPQKLSFSEDQILYMSNSYKNEIKEATTNTKCPDYFKHLPTGIIYACAGNDEGYYWGVDRESESHIPLKKFDQGDCEPLTIFTISIPCCHNCKPEMSQNYYAGTIDGVYECDKCGNIFDIPTGKYLKP